MVKKKGRIKMYIKFEYVVSEIQKYLKGIHFLNEGVDAKEIICFEEKYKVNIPNIYKEWLKLYNGGEFFALPVGTSFAGILGNSERKKGIFYLEDNFDNKKRIGALDNLFIIGELCDGELVGFDLHNTNFEDGRVIQYDVETGKIIDEWNSFVEWVNSIFEEGKEMFNYNGEDI